MTEQSLPKPNTQALSWFFGENKKGTLDLEPRYQRYPIWSPGQKCFLIDSLISGAPIPQVFLNIKMGGSGRERRTIYEVVDGQQRLRAILEYMDDEYPLIATTARSYPVSDAYKPHIGKKYSELPGGVQDAIWNYSLAVQELRGWTEDQIRALFRRLNYVVERLNKQELRHSQYFGEFSEAVESLADESFWDVMDFFTRRDAQRMKDIEFISELFLVLMAGPQEGQRTLDEFYARFDVDFPEKARMLARFRKTLASLATIGSYLKKSRYLKKGDFYGLFAATAELNRDKTRPVNLSLRVAKLKRLERQLAKDPNTLSGVAAQYYGTVIEGPNKKAKRQERIRILLTALSE